MFRNILLCYVYPDGPTSAVWAGNNFRATAPPASFIGVVRRHEKTAHQLIGELLVLILLRQVRARRSTSPGRNRCRNRTQTRYRRGAHSAARRDPDRQAGRLDRPGEPGTVPVRSRGWVEPGRNGRPRHRLCDPLQASARIDRGDEGDLDEGK